MVFERDKGRRFISWENVLPGELVELLAGYQGLELVATGVGESVGGITYTMYRDGKVTVMIGVSGLGETVMAAVAIEKEEGLEFARYIKRGGRWGAESSKVSWRDALDQLRGGE